MPSDFHGAACTPDRPCGSRTWCPLIERRNPQTMPHDTRRPDRVAEAIREEVATFLAEGVKDPRVVGLVTVTGVDVTRDLRHAKVFVSILGSDAERAATLDGLGSVASHLRSRIGRALRLRLAPEIAFKLDQSVAHAARIESLLAQIHDGRPVDEKTPDSNERTPPSTGGSTD
jgi:ribosome-binding factor A